MSSFEVQQFYSKVGNTFITRCDTQKYVQLISAGRFVCTDLSEPLRGKKKYDFTANHNVSPRVKGASCQTLMSLRRLTAGRRASDHPPN